MSRSHPIIAITGSSGAGSADVSRAFDRIFRREQIKAVYIQGSSFHRFERSRMAEECFRGDSDKAHFSHFGPECNMLDKLESLFHNYSANGSGRRRFYLHSWADAEKWNQPPGTFTPWEDIEPGASDLLLYSGLHGGAVAGDIDLAQYVDLLIGVVPIVNLEWIHKMHRDTSERGYSREEVKRSILRRMHDYVHYITPQFSRTHINFQRVPTVDTSDPFAPNIIPSEDESFVVINFNKGLTTNFLRLLDMIPNAQMSRPKTLIIPGGKLSFAMETILAPLVHGLMEGKRVGDTL